MRYFFLTLVIWHKILWIHRSLDSSCPVLYTQKEIKYNVKIQGMAYYAFTTWLFLVPSTLPGIWACAVESRIWYFNGCRNQFAINAIFNENKTKRSVKYWSFFTDSFHSHIILTGLWHEPQLRQYRSEYKLERLCTFTIIYRIKTFTKNCNNAFFIASAIF